MAATSARHWHSATADAVAAELGVEPGTGLSTAAAEARRQEHGPNRLQEAPPRPRWRRFADQFNSLLIGILAAAALIALLVGDWRDMVVILTVVVFNAVLGFYQEQRAEQSLLALKSMLAPKARVRRAGQIMEIAAADLVPGDLLLLEAGDKVAADGRLIEAHRLEIDESSLTGESQAVSKDSQPLAAGEVALAERRNQVFMNTVVTRGRAVVLVTETGMQTEIGRIAGLIATSEQPATPLQGQLDRLGKRLAGIAGLVVVLIFLLALGRGEPLVASIMTAITLAVAAIPEGLPAVVTVTLALGMHRMAGQRAIVKRLAAVETLGCTTVICTDKTGTLTLNQMQVRSLFAGEQAYPLDAPGKISGAAVAELLPLLHVAALCNDARLHDHHWIGDPTEGALLRLAQDNGVDLAALRAQAPRLAEIPFDSSSKFMATVHREGEQFHLLVKGAPEVLIEHCSTGANQQVLDAAARQRLLAANEALAASGQRVLAFASRPLSAGEFDPHGDLSQHLHGLCLHGLAGIMDPPRPEARAAIALCRTAGIQVKMITGDHPATALAIARELGLEGGVLTGAELDRLTPAELAAHLEHGHIFARVAPHHKIQLVQALQAAGHVVAMTGDGVNDAPALRGADIGVAMGITGSAVAKEASAMVLTDDNFASIVRAVSEGRTLYDNLVKFVRFQLSTNMGALTTVLGASLLGLPVPLNPVQILWVNMIMDGPPAMALGVEPAPPDSMQRPPRPAHSDILTGRRLATVAFFGLTMAIGTLGVFWFDLQRGNVTHALTLAFTTFVFFQFFNAFNARAEQGTAFNRHFFRNRPLWLSLTGMLALQVAAVHWEPAQAIFRTTALGLADWGLVLAVSSSVLVLEELRKWLVSRHPGFR